MPPADCCTSTRCRRPGRIACDIDGARRRPDDASPRTRSAARRAPARLIRRGDIHIAEPLIKGGGQERGLRAGTENVAAIAGFGAAAAAAAAAATQTDAAHMAALRDRLEAGLKAATPQAVIFGAGAPRLPNTTLFRGSRHEGGDRDDRLRSQRRSGVVRFRLLVRQGARPRMCWRPWALRPNLRAARCASASAGAPPKPTWNGSLELGISLSESLLKERRGIAA